MMRFLLFVLILSLAALPGLQAQAPKIDSIAFHLYTDSLKKGGIHNYINIDGKLSDGTWLPLSAKEIKFTSTAGKFDGNDLIFDSSLTADSVVVTAVLKSDTSLSKSITIYIKKLPDNEVLKSMEDVMGPANERPARKRRRG